MRDYREGLSEAVRAAIEAYRGDMGATCPGRDEHDVEQWIYDLDCQTPVAVGACRRCSAVVLWELPKAFNPRYRHLVVSAEVQALSLLEQGIRDRALCCLSLAGREELRGRGGMVPSIAAEHPTRQMVVRREIWQTFCRRLAAEAEEAIVAAETRRLAELTALAGTAHQLREERSRLSRAGVRRSLRKVIEAKERAAAELRALQQEVVALRREARDLRDQLREQHAAARRVPLPIPAGYAAPPVDRAAVLCDAVAPPQVVYALVDPADPELVRYVGRTSDPVGRYAGHVLAGEPRVAAWVRALATAGRQPVMVLLERCEDAEVIAREAHWIHHYRDRWQADLNTVLPRRVAR